MVFIATSLYLTLGIKISALIVEKGYGTASDGSTVIMLLSLGSALSGSLFGRMMDKIDRYLLPLGLTGVSLALLILSISNNLFLSVAAGFLAGFSFSTMMPFFNNIVNNGSFNNAAYLTSLLLIAYNLGTALTPYTSMLIQNIIGTPVLSRLILVNSLLMLGLMVFTIFLVNYVWKKQESTPQTNTI